MLTPSLSISFRDFRRFIVYGWRREGKYLYIGQSIRFLRRIQSEHHVLDKKDKIRKTDFLDIWFCYSKEDINNLEKSLIFDLRPIYNIQSQILEREELNREENYRIFIERFNEEEDYRKYNGQLRKNKSTSFKESFKRREEIKLRAQKLESSEFNKIFRTNRLDLDKKVPFNLSNDDSDIKELLSKLRK